MVPEKRDRVILIDDDTDDNFLHRRLIEKSGLATTIVTKKEALEALEYLKSKTDRKIPHPDLIFLDISMPGMNGWEFLDAYCKLDKELQNRSVITILTTSEDPEHKARALSYNVVADFRTKPLTLEMLEEIATKYI